MSALSTRFSLPLLLMIAVALISVSRSILWPTVLDDCARPDQLFDPLLIDETSEELAELPWDVSRPAGRVSGTLPPRTRREVLLEFTIVRAWGLPVRFLQPIPPTSLEPDRNELRSIEVNGRVLPVHLSSQQIESETRFAAFYFIYDGEPVNGAFFTRLRWAARELISGALPITVVRILARSPSRLVLQQTEQRAEEWLAKAWVHYENVCRSSGGETRRG